MDETELTEWEASSGRRPDLEINTPCSLRASSGRRSESASHICTLTMIFYLFFRLFCLSAVEASSSDSNWPQWRGPDSQGISPEKDLPVEWSVDKNIEWKTPIAGRGHSSPIVWENKIFLTTSIEGPVVPGAKAVKHMQDKEEFLHPDSVGAHGKIFIRGEKHLYCIGSKTKS
jgi:hypothetical protein